MVDKVEQVTNDESVETALRLAKEEGLLVVFPVVRRRRRNSPGTTGRLCRQDHRGAA